MRTLTPALASHITQPETTLATVWRVQLMDGRVLGFTDHDQPITFDGVTYAAASGFTASAIELSSALAVDNLQIQGMLSSPALTEADLMAGVWDYAAIDIFLLNWADPTDGRIWMHRGHLGQVSARRTDFVAEMRGLTDAYQRRIGRTYGIECDADLGDARCKVNLGPLTVTGTVDSVQGNRVIIDSARTEPGPGGAVSITGVSHTNPCQITTGSPHGFLAGSQVKLVSIGGIWELNGGTFTVLQSLDPTHFTIPADTTDAEPYTGGGYASTLTSGYFDFGVITFTSGLNAGKAFEIKSYAPGQFVLQQPAHFQIAAGDAYTATPGCDKQLNTCRDKYNNVVNHRGFPYIPGNDKVMKVGSALSPNAVTGKT